MQIDGRCLCGHITYEAEIDPERVAICHCTDCQTLSGAAFRTVAFSTPGSFRITKGRIKEYVKTAASGNARPQGFCPDCGTPIYATSPGEDATKVHSLRVGAIHQRDHLPPKQHVWNQSRQTWLSGIERLPVHDTVPGR